MIQYINDWTVENNVKIRWIDKVGEITGQGSDKVDYSLKKNSNIILQRNNTKRLCDQNGTTVSPFSVLFNIVLEEILEVAK